MDIIKSIEHEQMKNKIPELKVGNTVKVHVRVKEGNRERIQVFEGTIIKVQGGGVNQTFTVRRLSYGVGVEKTFLVHSPNVEKVEVTRVGKARRAKLFYLREKLGKAAKTKEKVGARIETKEVVLKEEMTEVPETVEETVVEEVETTEPQAESATNETPKEEKAEEQAKENVAEENNDVEEEKEHNGDASRDTDKLRLVAMLFCYEVGERRCVEILCLALDSPRKNSPCEDDSHHVADSGPDLQKSRGVCRTRKSEQSPRRFSRGTFRKRCNHSRQRTSRNGKILRVLYLASLPKSPHKEEQGIYYHYDQNLNIRFHLVFVCAKINLMITSYM